MKVVRCQICLRVIPKTFSDQHHVRPQAAGGKAEDEATLCEADHQGLHGLASMLMNPKRAGGAEDEAAVLWPDPPTRRRAMAMAEEVVRWMRLKKDGALARPDIQRIMIELPTPVKDALHLTAREAKISVDRLVAGLATEFIYKRYPTLRPKPL